MNAYFGNQPIFGPRGPSGPDGNPIGTVLPYMGLVAPTDYLLCDGSTYDISDYPDLTDFIETNYGTKNFFGGDGTSTFAVPNMKDLFLRGYNPDEDGLSGELGVKQDGTVHKIIGTDGSANTFYAGIQSGVSSESSNRDSIISSTGKGIYVSGSVYTNNAPRNTYTSRPVNMAVNYIIKATNAQPILDDYDTDDGWHVRKWSDGYVEMWRRVEFTVAISEYVAWGSLWAKDPAVASMTLPVQLVKKYAELSSVTSTVYLDIVSGTNMSDRSLELFSTRNYGIVCGQKEPISSGEVELYVTGRWK